MVPWLFCEGTPDGDPGGDKASCSLMRFHVFGAQHCIFLRIKCVNRWCPWKFRLELIRRAVTRAPNPWVLEVCSWAWLSTIQSKHLIFWKKTSAPLCLCSIARSRDCWQKLSPGEWLAHVTHLLEQFFLGPNPPLPPLPPGIPPATNLSCSSSPHGRQSRGNERQWAACRVALFAPGSVAAHLAWGGFDIIQTRGRWINQNNSSRMFLITLRPRI